VGPRTGLDDVEKRKILILTGLELRPLRRNSQSLYRLSCLQSRLFSYTNFRDILTLKMEAIYSFETLVLIYRTASYHKPEYRNVSECLLWKLLLGPVFLFTELNAVSTSLHGEILSTLKDL
jgi:hypothetical protein